MSLEPVLARIAQIESAIADPATLTGAGTSGASGSAPVATAATASSSFANLLGSATGTTGNAVAQTEALDSMYSMQALQTLAGGDQDATDSMGVNPSSDLLALIQSGALGSTSSSSLAGIGTATAAAPASAYPGVTAGGNQAIVQVAEGQVGQVEQPFGSNDGPAISMYRSAVAGAEPGEPWCAQFASWVANQAGIPLGDQGQGFSAVSDVWSWAQQTGRAIPNGPGVVPQPGDLIVFGDAHIGIVVGVQPNGDIDTVEGNYDNQVSRNVRSPDEATGYVNMSE